MALICHILLFPLYLLSLLYGIAVKTRLLLYRAGLLETKKLDCPVISVGNITIGGTGKTPAVEYICRNLTKRGIKVAVLSRGYKGKAKGDINTVSDGKDVLLGPDEAGDEPFMLAKKLEGVPVIVGPDRFKTGQYVLEKFNPQVIVLDDGFQHVRLHRDMNIMVVDGNKIFGNSFIFPRGPLREPLSGIKRSDMIFVNCKATSSAESMDFTGDHIKDVPIFKGHYRPVKFKSIKGKDSIDLKEIKGKEIAVVSAIADPASFIRLLNTLGCRVVKEFTYPDHHAYGTSEIEDIIKDSKALGAKYIVTTEKDAVKLKQLYFEEDISLYFLEITLDMQDKENVIIDAIISGSGINTD